MWSETFDCKNEIRRKMWSPPPSTGYSGLLDTEVVYKFQDPKTYSGPVVQGWEPGKLKHNQAEAYQACLNMFKQIERYLSRLKHI